MESRNSQGTAGRMMLFIGLTLAIFLANIAIQSRFAPDPEEVAAPDEMPALVGEDKEGQVAEIDEVESTVSEPEFSPSDLAADADDSVIESDDEETAQPKFPTQSITLGSLDPDGPYRMLATVTSRGAAVARIELSSPDFRDSEDRTGYLGHIVNDETIRGAGCPVQVVGAGTPAAIAGIVPGDVIKQVGGTKVTGFLTLRNALRKTKPGEKVDVTILRDEQEQVLSVTLGRRPLEIMRPETVLQDYDDVKERDGLRGLRADDDPLSFLFTLEQIDDLRIAEPAKDDEEEEDDKDRDESVSEELPGLSLRTANWELVSSTEEEAVFAQTLPKWGLKVVKTYRMVKVPVETQDDPYHAGYHLVFSVAIENIGSTVRKVAYRLDGPTGLPTEGAWYANKVGPGWGMFGLRDLIVSYGGRKPEWVKCVAIADGSDSSWRDDEALSFIGIDAQYFSAIMIPQNANPKDPWLAETQPIRVGAVSGDWKKTTNVSCRLSSLPIELEPGQSVSHEYQVFAGPKRPKLLKEYGLKETLYYGWFKWVAIPMLWILHFLHDYLLFNFGLAIIVLTIMVRSMMHPMSRKQMANARKMQLLQPEIRRIAEKYKDNMEGRTKAQQELFKKHNYHPLSGCGLIFLQLPIFIGLYRSLMVDVELRMAPLISESVRWCSNLAAPDMLFNWADFWVGMGWESFPMGQGIFALGPYFNLLPLMTVVLFIVQQKIMMPPPADEQAAMQAKVMKFMMVFIGFMFFKVASGLCIYFIASSLWGLAERKLMPKQEPIEPAAPEGDVSAAQERRAEANRQRRDKK